MSDRYAHVMSFAVTHPWAIDPAMMPVLSGILARHVAGVDSRADIEAALVNRANLPQPRAGSVAIIPVYGVIAPRVNMMSEMSGGTTFDKLTSQLRTAMAEKSVKTIVLDVNSPGGSVAGASEFSAEVRQARAKKPILAVAQYTMASAAYWVASAATHVYAAPSAMLGSVGVYSIHDDLSEALAKLGVKRRYLSAGEGKVDGNEAEPLSKDAEADMQSKIDKAYGRMVKDTVTNRGTGMTAERVTKDWKAHIYDAHEALSIGMIDGIATLDETLARILTASPDASDQRAALDFSTDATDQERREIAATSQERVSDEDLERQLFELALT